MRLEIRSVPRKGGQLWEWDHEGLTYIAESINGSPNVHVYSVVTADMGEWEYVLSRPTSGHDPKSVAQTICDDVVCGRIDRISRVMKNVAIALFDVWLDVKTEDGMAAVEKAVTAIGDTFWPDDNELRKRWISMCLNAVES